MDIGIRQLKAHLSEYLERAARGESIRVTDRGQPKAILGPIPGAVRLEEGISKGWVTPPRTNTAPVAIRRGRAAERTEHVLADDRGE